MVDVERPSQNSGKCLSAWKAGYHCSMDQLKLEALYEAVNPRPAEEAELATWVQDRDSYIQSILDLPAEELPGGSHIEFMAVLAGQVEVLNLARRSVDELTSFGRNFLRISDRTLAGVVGVSHPTIAKRDTTEVRAGLDVISAHYLRAELNSLSGR